MLKIIVNKLRRKKIVIVHLLCCWLVQLDNSHLLRSELNKRAPANARIGKNNQFKDKK